MIVRTLEPVLGLSKSREVLLRLRNGIWSGDLLPGTALREAHIARQLNVSQVPVREALLQLEHLGLVVRVPDRGTTVTKLTRLEVEHRIDVRRHLEEMAFTLAAKNWSPQLEAELTAHLTRMAELVKRKDDFGVAEEDFQFHRTVWRASGNQVLAETLERLCTSLYAFVSLKRHSAGEHAMKEAPALHRRLLEALRTRKPKTILAAVREHLVPKAVIPDSIQE